MLRLSKALAPLTDLMRTLALKSSVVQADETPVKMLAPGQGRTSTTYLWAVLGGQQYPYTTFSFTESRSRAGPTEFFADFEGTLVPDAYIGYELLSSDSQGRIANRELSCACASEVRGIACARPDRTNRDGDGILLAVVRSRRQTA
jgi:hypothetical protein